MISLMLIGKCQSRQHILIDRKLLHGHVAIRILPYLGNGADNNQKITPIILTTPNVSSGLFLCWIISLTIIVNRTIAVIIAITNRIIFWLLSAPLPRYGVVYMMFVPCITIGMSTHNDILRKYVENKIYVRLNKADQYMLSALTFSNQH